MKTIRKAISVLLLVILVLSAFTACGKKGTEKKESAEASSEIPEKTSEDQEPAKSQEPEAGQEPAAEAGDDDVDGELILDHEEELEYAQFFTLTHYKGGYKSFTIIGGQEDYEWLIVPEGKSVPEDLPDHVVVLQQPIDKIRCDSGTAGIIAAFGGLDHVSSVNTEQENWAIDAVRERMEAGDIVFSGKYKEPDYETITAAGTQLVIETNMLDSNPEVKEKYEELGIPFFVTRNSKEVHPLGHSEWAKVYGAVLGMWEEANAYFEDQIEKVEKVTTDEKLGKTVALVYFSLDGTKVYARRGGDHMATMAELAGGEYIMADFEPEETGVGTITNEDFYAMCKDADYLINLNMAAKLYTMEELLDYVPVMEDFKAVKEGNVYMACERFSQFMYDNASIITDLNTILKDPSVEETTYFSKMK